MCGAEVLRGPKNFHSCQSAYVLGCSEEVQFDIKVKQSELTVCGINMMLLKKVIVKMLSLYAYIPTIFTVFKCFLCMTCIASITYQIEL
jgi:hypothetical protein